MRDYSIKLHCSKTTRELLPVFVRKLGWPLMMVQAVPLSCSISYKENKETQQLCPWRSQLGDCGSSSIFLHTANPILLWLPIKRFKLLLNCSLMPFLSYWSASGRFRGPPFPGWYEHGQTWLKCHTPAKHRVGL